MGSLRLCCGGSGKSFSLVRKGLQARSRWRYSVMKKGRPHLSLMKAIFGRCLVLFIAGKLSGCTSYGQQRAPGSAGLPSSFGLSIGQEALTHPGAS